MLYIWNMRSIWNGCYTFDNIRLKTELTLYCTEGPIRPFWLKFDFRIKRSNRKLFLNSVENRKESILGYLLMHHQKTEFWKRKWHIDLFRGYYAEAANVFYHNYAFVYLNRVNIMFIDLIYRIERAYFKLRNSDEIMHYENTLLN